MLKAATLPNYRRASVAGGIGARAPRSASALERRAPIPGVDALSSRGLLRMRPGHAAADAELEREADRISERVVRMPSPGWGGSIDAPFTRSVSGAPRIQRKCAACEEDTVQRKAKSDGPVNSETFHGTGSNGAAPAAGAGGRPLTPAERDFFEPRFGLDFSHVRVHDDARAASSARAWRARAFTLGSNVVLGQGEYTSGSAAGQQLMAHELAHVVQQTGPRFLAGAQPATQPLTLSARTPVRLSRQPLDDAQPAEDDERAVPAAADEVSGASPAEPATEEGAERTPEQSANELERDFRARGGVVEYSTARTPEEDPRVREAGRVPSNTRVCTAKWQFCRAPFSPGTWAVKFTYHCPRLLLPFGIILPGTTRPAFATIPDEFVGTSPTGRDMFRCRPRSQITLRSDLADVVATALTRVTLFPNAAACHAGFRGNLLTTLNAAFVPSGGGRPAGVRVNSTPPGFGGRAYPCP